jgi:hypothetical protein
VMEHGPVSMPVFSDWIHAGSGAEQVAQVRPQCGGLCKCVCTHVPHCLGDTQHACSNGAGPSVHLGVWVICFLMQGEYPHHGQPWPPVE